MAQREKRARKIQQREIDLFIDAWPTETPKTAMHLHWLVCMYVQGSIVENTLTTGKKPRAQGESESQQSKMELPWGCRDNGLSKHVCGGMKEGQDMAWS